MKTGTVYWFTGLSGAGKTTLGKLFFTELKKRNINAVFLDGDLLREVFGNDLGHSLTDRQKSAMRNSRLCKMLSDQGIDVVCATISMFHACRNWNRENIMNYQEIYIRVDYQILLQRDQKKLYSKALNGEVANVVGIDLEFEEPDHPDIIIDNNGESSPEVLVSYMIERLLSK